MIYRFRNLIRKLQNEKDRLAARLFRYTLSPTTLCYFLILGVRNLCYDLRFFHSRTLLARVISIGNITTGGTGKTPVVMLLAGRMIEKQITTALLSRGYKSTSESKNLILTSNEAGDSGAQTAGDEVALMAAKLPNLFFGIGSDRYRSGVMLIQRASPKVFLLDDGFQHRKLRRDCDIVLIDLSNPFGNGWLLPSGPLRESLSSLRRADIVILTRAESVSRETQERLINEISHYVPLDKIFLMQTTLDRILQISDRKEVSVDSLKHRKLWLFCGIGNPESFRAIAESNGLIVAGNTFFPDHHCYTQAEITSLLNNIRTGRADAFLTTEKDAVKLKREWIGNSECLVMGISFAFVERENIFWKQLGEVIDAEI